MVVTGVCLGRSGQRLAQDRCLQLMLESSQYSLIFIKNIVKKSFSKFKSKTKGICCFEEQRYLFLISMWLIKKKEEEERLVLTNI